MDRPGIDRLIHRPRHPAGLAAAPVLIALAVIVAATLDFRGVAAASGREPARMAARPLTAIARAVRDLVGAPAQRPVARGRSVDVPAPVRERAPAMAGVSAGTAVHHVRTGLLNLPPPAATL